MENNNKKQLNKSNIQSVDRAISLLKLISKNSQPSLINKLTKETKLNRTTVWRILKTLESHDFVERDPFSQGYQLGFSAIQIGQNGSKQYESLIRRAGPAMEYLLEETQEAILLSVPRHISTVTVKQLNPLHSVLLIDYTNLSLPLHCTSNGKVFLSLLSLDELKILLKEPLEKYSEFTIADNAELKKELCRVRKDGYATVFGELSKSENGISAPIMSQNGSLIAFLSIAGPNFRFTKDKVFETVPQLFKAVREIELSLGV